MINLMFQDRRLVISGKALILESHLFDFQNPTIRGIAISFILGKYFITFFSKITCIDTVCENSIKLFKRQYKQYFR